MTYATGQAVVIIDCDLQDPPGLIPEMVRIWREGTKVVIPQRTSREGETLIKRIVSYVGYWSSTASRSSRFRATRATSASIAASSRRSSL